MRLKRPSTPVVDADPIMERGTLLKGAGFAALIAAGFGIGVGVGGDFGPKQMTIPEVREIFQSTKVQTENK
jgi:hypothetical protein